MRDATGKLVIPRQQNMYPLSRIVLVRNHHQEQMFLANFVMNERRRSTGGNAFNPAIHAAHSERNAVLDELKSQMLTYDALPGYKYSSAVLGFHGTSIETADMVCSSGLARVDAGEDRCMQCDACTR